MKKVYLIGIWWIWMSWLARYYLSEGYVVLWSDKNASSIISQLESEWAHISIWENISSIDNTFETVIYSEAIPVTHSERLKAIELKIETLSYAQAIWKISEKYNLVCVSGTHGKSTTTAILSLIFKETNLDFITIVWTLVPDFWMKNFYKQSLSDFQDSWYFILESCEYRESFLNYKPQIAIITNIETDHLDYFKNEDTYIEAFNKFILNIRPWGFVVLNMEDDGVRKLKRERTDINYVEIYKDFYLCCWETYSYGNIEVQVPWEHILVDTKLAYSAWFLCNIKPEEILSWIKKYWWTWRRMEKVWETENGNVVISDYGHHPTEIEVTTKALKEASPDKELICIFQPHQYSRTIELLEGFKKCFSYCDMVIVPNIYASRDSKEDIERMSAELFVSEIEAKNKLFWDGFENTLKIISEMDSKKHDSRIFLLLWAWDIDTLRDKIKTTK